VNDRDSEFFSLLGVFTAVGLGFSKLGREVALKLSLSGQESV
jgi:hypothetical protein